MGARQKRPADLNLSFLRIVSVVARGAHNLLSLPVDRNQCAARLQRTLKNFLENFFLVAIVGRMLLPDHRIGSDGEQGFPVLRPKRPQLNQLSGKVRLQFKIHHCGSAHENSTPPALVTTYCRPSNSYVIGELCIGDPAPACHSVFPSLVRNAKTLPCASPVKINPESVVRTPAPAPLGPRSWLHRILPVS